MSVLRGHSKASSSVQDQKKKWVTETFEITTETFEITTETFENTTEI